MIKGRAYRFEEKHNDNARNLFFEADFALRFICSEENFQKIDLNYGVIKDECDIVIDDKIIIECKSISSSNQKKALKDHIKHANEQLITRLDNLPNIGAGIIAIDVTQICQIDWENEINNILIPQDLDASNPDEIKKLTTIISNASDSFFNTWLQKNDVSIHLFERLRLSENIYSIMVQSEFITLIDKKEADIYAVAPVLGRLMNPYNNPKYQGKVEFSPNFSKSLQHSF